MLDMDWKSTDFVLMAGWVVTFGLGILTTIVTQRLGRTKKKICWSVVSESSLLSKGVIEGIASEFRVPVQVLVDGEEKTDLNTIRVGIANTGNVEIEKIEIEFSFGDGARVHVGRYVENLGGYKKALRLEKSGNSAKLSVAHINPKQAFEVEFLVTDYIQGDFALELFAPGVELRKTDPFFLDKPVGLGFLHSVSYGLMGIKYDPVASHTQSLVEEVRGLRQVIEKNMRNGDG